MVILFHNKICERNPLPDNLLFLYNPVSSGKKKGLRGNGCMHCYVIPSNLLFQFITKCSGNSPVLIIFMDVQPVKTASFGHIGKPDYPVFLHGNHCIMFSQCPAPSFKIGTARSPCVQLLLRIVFRIHSVDRLTKQFCQRLTVCRLISSDAQHILPPRNLPSVDQGTHGAYFFQNSSSSKI